MALVAAIRRLTAAGIENAAADARLLLSDALGVAPARLTLVIRDPITAEARAAFDRSVEARIARRPVAQIIGRRLFWGRSFKVTQDTLDPRPETEILLEAALREPAGRVLDLGAGTGCILLSFLADCPAAKGLGVDLSPAALMVCRENADALGLSDRAVFRQGDWREAEWTRDLGTYDLILSNPPYIAETEMAELAPEVRQWEPYDALSPGGDGLEPYRIISSAAPSLLDEGGRILFEIGPTQAVAVSDMLRAAGLREVAVLQDWDGRDRVVMARR